MIRSRLSAIGAGAATDAVSALRSSLSNAVLNTGVDDIGTSANGNPFNFTNADVNAQAFRRTPQQVLSIAYGGGTAGGGFFPNGVNGAITTTVPQQETIEFHIVGQLKIFVTEQNSSLPASAITTSWKHFSS